MKIDKRSNKLAFFLIILIALSTTSDAFSLQPFLSYGDVYSGGDSEEKLYENKELDDTGQYYYGSRYYDPSKRIFVEPDSLIPNIYDPQQLNIYAFEKNNPYMYQDKDGNNPVAIIAVGLILLYVSGELLQPATSSEPIVDRYVPLEEDAPENIDPIEKMMFSADRRKDPDMINKATQKEIEAMNRALLNEQDNRELLMKGPMNEGYFGNNFQNSLNLNSYSQSNQGIISSSSSSKGKKNVFVNYWESLKTYAEEHQDKTAGEIIKDWKGDQEKSQNREK